MNMRLESVALEAVAGYPSPVSGPEIEKNSQTSTARFAVFLSHSVEEREGTGMDIPSTCAATETADRIRATEQAAAWCGRPLFPAEHRILLDR
jgi:hypothetical protein